jgi:hypothetical protein
VPGGQDVANVSLSWGGSSELLIATSSLNLCNTISEPSCSWTKPLPNPVKLATISYDSAYIASVGQHDALVKIWRRLTYGSDEIRFSLSYLKHPFIVTSLQWRKPYHVNQTIDNVLYTFCMDNKLRIWTASDSHMGQELQLWGQVNLIPSPQRQLHPYDKHNFNLSSFIIDGRDFSASTEQAVFQRGPGGGKDDVGMDHMIAIANKNPEICVAFDGRGTMSAWALENVGYKDHPPTSIFTIAQLKSKEFIFPASGSTNEEHLHSQIYSYCHRATGQLYLLFHHFNGTIHIYQANVADLFDPVSHSNRLSLVCTWSGHSTPVKKIVRNFSGRAIVSRTPAGESIVWRHIASRTTSELSRQCVIPESRNIHRICVLRKGRFVIFLGHDDISLWDCRQENAILLACKEFSITGQPLCLLILPRQRAGDFAVAHIATVTSTQKGIVWVLKLPQYSSSMPPYSASVENGQSSITEFCRFELKDATGLAHVLPVDPAGSSPVISNSLDMFTRDVAISYTHSGRVTFWAARVDQENQQVGWLPTSSTETSVPEPALVSGSTLKKAALVNSTRSQLTIWDVGRARLEYEQWNESDETIQDLDWTSTPDSQSILAVGFQHRIVLLSQMRFDYLNKGPAWAPICNIPIHPLTPHPIGDSTWLGDGHLVIGAGNQLFVSDRKFGLSSALVTSLRLPHKKDRMWDLFDVVQRLNGPLAVFHPQFLSQCILAGKTILVRRILVALHKTLKFSDASGTEDAYLGIPLDEFYNSTVCDQSSDSPRQIPLTGYSYQLIDTLIKAPNCILIADPQTIPTKLSQRIWLMQSTKNSPKLAFRSSRGTSRFNLLILLNASV